jgi:hypothetical protein
MKSKLTDICFLLQTFRNPKPALLALLRESGPVPGDENGLKSKRGATGEESAKKKKRTEKNVSDLICSRPLFEAKLVYRLIWTSSPMVCKN